VLLAVAAAGCHHHSVRSGPPPKAPPPDLPVVSRSAVEPDVSGLSLDPAPTRERPAQYRRLTAAECRHLALRNAPFADDLDKHPDNEAVKHPHLHPLKPSPDEARIGQQVRGHAADEQRNRAAGDALEEFFKLARAEGQFDLLARAHAELRTQLASGEEAIRRGLRDRADVDAIRVQLLDLEAQMAQLEAGIGSLNASLRARLGLDAHDPLPLWPDDPLRVRPDEVDPAEAVRTGLHYRPDLNALRALLSDDGTAAKSLMDLALFAANPLLAVAKSNPIIGVLVPEGKKAQRTAAEARRQVAALLEARERQAEAEIRAAALTLHGHRAAATARAAEVRQRTAKVRELEKRSAAGQQVEAELVKAKLDLLKAKGDLLQAATDWHIAEVKLRQAMGLLVRE
jgi:hypothetical protein